MMNLLKGNIHATLGCRLMTMSTICCLAFIIRSMIYGWEAYAGFMGGGKLFPDFSVWNGVFGRTVLGYLSLEWFPAMMALLLMHQRDKQAPAVEHSESNLMQLEAGVGIGQLSPLMDSVQANVVEGGATIAGGAGVKRSFSANGGVAVPFRRPSPLQHNNNQQPMAIHKLATSSAGGSMMSRSMSGGGPETKSLLGDKSKSAIASASNPASLYGAIHQ